MTDQLDPHFIQMLRSTLLIRRVEEKIIELYPSDKIQSPVHLSIGQEVVAVSICDAMGPDDLLFSTYRGHAFYIAKGGPLPELMAELYGRSGGLSGGKAGSMHLAAPDQNMMGSSAVVASTIPHAVGAALMAKQKGSDQVAVAIFGDGATEEGVYHECLNFAAVHKLPVLFICENNDLAVHTSLAERQAFELADHAQVYGLPVTVLENGNDLQLSRDTVSQELEAIRQGSGPRWLMMHTYRVKEHVGPGEDFDAGYRSREDFAQWQQTDPVHVYAEQVAEMEKDIAKVIDEAVAFAEASPVPGLADLLADVE